MNATQTVVVAKDSRSIGRRARTLDMDNVVAAAIRLAVESGRPRILARHGGSVPNSYGYPAVTDAILVVAFPDGRAAAWATEVPANKVTHRGVAAACLREAGDVYDRRVSDARRDAARAVVIAKAAEILG